MKAMAASLLACTMALLAMSEFQAEDCDESVAEAMRTELLQSTAVLANTQTHAHTRTHARRVQLDGDKSSTQSITPVFFLHVPKCGGTSLGKTILLFEGVCSKMTDQDRELLLTASGGYTSVGKVWGVNFSANAWEDVCSLVDLRFADYSFGDHSGIGMMYSRYIKGHGVTMLRQPEQRILSGYDDMFHSWSTDVFGREPNSQLEYAKVVAGCAVKMLTRDGRARGNSKAASVCGDPAPATNDETTLAIERLTEGFQFVGIVEEYEKSICLLHAMFGGTCTAQEFDSKRTTRSSSRNSTGGYDTSVLKGWTDEQDGKLFAEGMRLFQNNLQNFHVNTESCMLCMQEAGVV